MWFIIHVIAFTSLVLILQYAINDFVSKYIGIVMHDPIYPIQNVAFPAVSICPHNRISKKAAQEYANLLYVEIFHYSYALLID